MILTCKTTKKNRNTYYNNLTEGKSYDGTTYDRTTYLIRDDSGEVAIYPKKCFMTIEESRESNIDEILK